MNMSGVLRMRLAHARYILLAFALFVLVLLLGGCGYWDQESKYGDRPMFDLQGDGVQGRVSRALHEKFVEVGLADKEAEVITKMNRQSLSSGFFIADISPEGVDPQALRDGNVPGWVIGMEPAQIGVTKVEIVCRRVTSVPDWLRR